ncbi:MAG: molybdopterin adenylyltransferase [Planctomycetota bacterium]
MPTDGALIGIVTVSDRADRGVYEDRSGPALQLELDSLILPPWVPLKRLVPDDRGRIEEVLRDLCDEERCSLVISTGGTGPAPRDVTPEATEAVCSRLLPGFGERMRAASVAAKPTSLLSRQIAGIRARTLIVNLPGSPAALRECLRAVFPAIPHCVELIGGAPIRARKAIGGTCEPEAEE